jgi:hypothetical protein
MPAPRRREVRVKVKAAALNPKDSFVRKGRFKLLTGSTFPKMLGYDFAGVVDGLGPDVPKEWQGAEVFGMRNGFDGGAQATELHHLLGDDGNAGGQVAHGEAEAGAGGGDGVEREGEVVFFVGGDVDLIEFDRVVFGRRLGGGRGRLRVEGAGEEE